MKGKKKLFGKDFAKNFQVRSTERIFEKAYGTFSRKNLVLNDLEPFLPLLEHLSTTFFNADFHPLNKIFKCSPSFIPSFTLKQNNITNDMEMVSEREECK